MSIEFRALKTLGALRGATPDDIDKIAGLPDGQPIKMVATLHPRNELFHRWYFGLLGVVAANTDYNIDQLLHLVKVSIGHTDIVIMPLTGEVTYMTRSIAWGKMDEEKFRPFVQMTIDFICTRIIPGSTSAELEREVFARLGIDLSNVILKSEAGGGRVANSYAGDGGSGRGSAPLSSEAIGGRR